MPDIKAIQTALRGDGLDGWLFYDHHHRDPIAGRILGLAANGLVSRRWFYFIPSRGEPRKLVHRIEAGMLDSLPGRKTEYSSWEELQKGWDACWAGLSAWRCSIRRRIIFLISGWWMRGLWSWCGNWELRWRVRRIWCRCLRRSWSAEQLTSHLEAGEIVDRITRDAFARAGEFVRAGKALSEFELKQWILRAICGEWIGKRGWAGGGGAS